MEDLGEKIENPYLKNSSGVTGQKLALGEVEELKEFLEVKHSKSQEWGLHHVFSRSRAFRHYLRFSNRMSINQVIVI